MVEVFVHKLGPSFKDLFGSAVYANQFSIVRRILGPPKLKASNLLLNGPNSDAFARYRIIKYKTVDSVLKTRFPLKIEISQPRNIFFNLTAENFITYLR